MRVVWRDSNPKEYRPVKYRGYMVCGSTRGWTTNIPGDDNLYKSHYCALNAVDAALGGTGIRGAAGAKRRSRGIQVIGKRDSETG